LEALVRDRNVPQKQVWRAEIVLLSADGLGTNEIMHLALAATRIEGSCRTPTGNVLRFPHGEDRKVG